MTTHLLTLIIAVPLIGGLLVLFVPNRDEQGARTIQRIGLAVSLVTFALTLLLWSRFDGASAEFQFVELAPWIPAFGIDYHVGVDGISLWLVVLTGWYQVRHSSQGPSLDDLAWEMSQRTSQWRPPWASLLPSA